MMILSIFFREKMNCIKVNLINDNLPTPIVSIVGWVSGRQDFRSWNGLYRLAHRVAEA
jgi:hypothetical protein